MHSLLPFYFYAFGLVAIGGGIMGFAKAKSRASLIAGSVSGGLLLAAGWLATSSHATAGLVLGGVVSLALAGRFAPAYRKQGKFFPAGIMALLGAGGILVSIVGLAG